MRTLKLPIKMLKSCLAALLLAAAGQCLAQDGDSTAGLSRTRYLGSMGILPASRDVVVEDFINYHRHEIPRPKAGDSVALDVRWGQNRVGRSGEAVLQVGISTALAHDPSELPPMNLAIVIDKSGSMAEDNKMVRVKESLLKLVSQLRPTDTLSLVQFDSDASVLVPACQVTDRESIDNAIRQLEPGSATNLESGLMLGYKEALKHLRKDGTNRVILLTDGIANRGVTDPNQIANEASRYTDDGIDLCTIGVGSDVNQDFLHTLATRGRGLFHFVANSDDIQKVFVDELQSQLSPVASEADLSIQYGPGLKLGWVYGYTPVQKQGRVAIKLNSFNSGMTEAVLLTLKPDGEESLGSKLPVSVRLRYYDLQQKKEVELDEDATINVGDSEDGAVSKDPSVAKNFCIARMAQAIHEMARDCEAQQFSNAQRVIGAAVDETAREYPSLDDADIKRTLGIAMQYRDVLRQRTGDTEEDRPAPAPESAPNLIVNGDFSQGNSHFMSGLEYIYPRLDCLWGLNYTIAPSFLNPFLHHLVQPQDYSAPERPNGNEQVLFANAGGGDRLILWSAVVPCKPHTRYRISFQAVSLSGSQFQDGHEIATADWQPDFRIRANGAASAPQKPGLGHYSNIEMMWDSADANSATISIIRLPIAHGGGLIGIASIEMVAAERARPWD